MIKEAIAEGATIEEAIANAKKALGAPFDAEIHTEVLAMPKKKVLGLFGGSPAKAKASYDAPEEKRTFEKKPVEKKQAEKKPTEKKSEPAAEKKAFSPKAPAQKPEAVKAEEADLQQPVQEPAKEIARTKIDPSEKASIEVGVAYLKKLVLGMGAEKAEVEAYRTEEDEIVLELDCGEDYGIVIGRRGDTLDSIQYLTRLAAGRKKEEGDYTRISINVGDYREKRRNTLVQLAKKNSAKVLKYGRNFTFEPMNPYERRIIHTTVQEIEGVNSHSVGSDSDRRVVITLAEGFKPTHPSKGGYNNRRPYQKGRGRNNGYRPRNGGQRRPQQSDAPQRAPKTDAGAEGFSLYGKIN